MLLTWLSNDCLSCWWMVSLVVSLLKCTSVTCKKNEHCALKGGVRDCYPVSYATCHAAGDPHYRSFDNRRFDFQGTCTYVLSQHTDGSNQGLLPFQVLVQNENRGRNKRVSYTKSVSLTVIGYTVSMSRVDQGKILVSLIIAFMTLFHCPEQ